MPEPETHNAAPSVWLLSAAKEDGAVIRRSCSHERQSTPFLFLDLDDGRTPISPDDLILLKTPDRPGLDLFAPTVIHDAMGTAGLVHAVKNLLISGPELSQPRRTLDLGMVTFGGNALRATRRGWSRTEIEKILDALLCTHVALDPVLSHRLSGELMEQITSEEPSLLRAIALRLRADAVNAIKSDAAAAVAAYAKARVALREAGAGRQAAATGRLEKRTLTAHAELQSEFWPRGEDARRRLAPFGFRLRRFSGMKLPVSRRLIPNLVGARGMLRHRHVASFAMDDVSLAAWIAGAAVSTSMASAHAVAAPFDLEEGMLVEFVVDSELATRAGLAGRVFSPLISKTTFRLMPRSETCRMRPSSADTRFGKPVYFQIDGPPRPHRIDLLVLTSDAAQTSISLTVRPGPS